MPRGFNVPTPAYRLSASFYTNRDTNILVNAGVSSDNDTASDNTRGLFGLRCQQTGAGAFQSSVLVAEEKYTVPVQDFWIPGATIAKNRVGNYWWECDHGVCFTSRVDTSGTGNMWAGYGLGGAVGIQNPLGTWQTRDFLGFLWDPRQGPGGATGYSAVLRDAAGTDIFSADTGVTAIDERHRLTMRIGQRLGAAFCDWISDGATVVTLALPGGAWVPATRGMSPAIITAREDATDEVQAWSILNGYGALRFQEEL